MNIFKIVFILMLPICVYASNLHVKLLEPLLGIKYRVDGVTNIKEEYTVFEKPSITYKKAGFNCSGFVLAGARQLLGKSITIKEAIKDINFNSDENSSLGKDWDFGRDLILNIAKPFKYRFLNYDDIDINSSSSDGIRLNDHVAWSDMFQQMKKSNIYLTTFSKRDKKDRILYYHVGIIIKDDNSNIWLYHSTPKSGVHRVWLDFDKNMTPFKKEYPAVSSSNKKALILELDLSLGF